MALTKVSTDGVKDDAITSGKIPANAVGASELADNAVDTNAIANNAVTAGKTSGVSTTINNNADNRVITGSGTANTLNGESSVVIDANGKLGVGNTNPADFDAYADRLVVGTTSGNNGMTIVAGSSNSSSIYFADGTSGGSQKNAGIVDYNHSADKMRFATAASDAMVIDSSGKVGINETTPDNRLHIKDSNPFIEIEGTSNSGDAGIFINAGANHWLLRADNYTQANAFTIKDGTVSSSTHRLGVQAGTGNVTLHTGNLVIGTAGKGIDFSANSNASGMTSELLDDYEEGTYNPTLTGQGGGSISIYSNEATLSYTKVGNIVHVHGRIRLHIVNNSMSGQARLSLPFTAASGSNTSNQGQSSVATHGVTLNSSSDIGIFLETVGGTSNGYLNITRYSASWVSVTANQFGGTGATSNHYLAFNHTYQAA